VVVKLESKGFFWIEDVIAVVEEAASSGLYSVLKRADEKFVTERAYENPRFVEDVVREVYLGLQNFRRSDGALEESESKGGDCCFRWFSVEAENFESIHNHNAYAYAEFQE
jgi:GTP cyclohydrolase I